MIAMSLSCKKISSIIEIYNNQRKVLTSNVRRSSRILVWGLIQFNWNIVPVRCNPTGFRSIELYYSCHLTDFQIDRVTMSIRSDWLNIEFKYYQTDSTDLTSDSTL